MCVAYVQLHYLYYVQVVASLMFVCQYLSYVCYCDAYIRFPTYMHHYVAYVCECGGYVICIASIHEYVSYMLSTSFICVSTLLVLDFVSYVHKFLTYFRCMNV